MKNTAILIGMSVGTLVLGALLNLDATAFVPGLVGLALGMTLLRAGKSGSDGLFS